jgi:methionine synthase I (cobalamin-dependent)
MQLETLLRNGPVLTDGAWGTQLQALGLPIGACPDPWNLERPDLVEQVPRAYVEAGSRVVLTNTFRANRIALAMHGVPHSAVEINRAGVEISRRAAGGRAFVFASIGPSGKMLLAGDVTEVELHAAFEEQANALAEAGADALVVETMADLTEATLALRAARQTGLPVVVSMVFDSGARWDRTMMGITPEDAARTLTHAGADVIGANCGQGIEGYLEICRRLRAATDRPLWIKANAGLPRLVEGQAIYPTMPAQFAQRGLEVVAAGASFVGGCCGTSPETIRALRQELMR